MAHENIPQATFMVQANAPEAARASTPPAATAWGAYPMIYTEMQKHPHCRLFCSISYLWGVFGFFFGL